MVQLERIIIVVSNKRRLKPILVKYLKKLYIEALGRHSMRVSASVVEVGILAEDLNEGILEYLKKNIGDIIEERRIGGIRGNPIDAYVDLVKEQRYWEAHEVLESLWSRNRNPIVHALIQIAAAQAKAQEGRLGPALRILRRAVGHPDISGLFNVKCLVKETIKTYIKGSSNILACILPRD